ncbi:MAG: hypothetical protein ACP5KN_20540, partial [Armatimonadota bacterium]
PEEYPEGTLVTNYYYRAGRRHNGLPPAVLVADHEPAHNDRANVLMSDGAIRSLPEPRWRQMGFRTPDEILQERFPERYGQVEPGACCAPPMSPPEGPPREPPGEARE